MNVFHRVTVSTLKKNSTRTIVTIIGVVLSAAMIMAITTFISSMINFMVETIQAEEGNWHAQIYNTTAEKLEELKGDDEIDSVAAAENVGYAKVTDSNGTWLVNIMGFSKDTYSLAPVTVMNGRLPETSDEIALESSFARNSYKVGDKLTLSVGDRYYNGETLYQCDELTVRYDEESGDIAQWIESLKGKEKKTYTVVGIIERPGFESYNAAGYSAITAASGTAGDYRAFVKMKNPKTIFDFTDNALGNLKTRIHSELLRYMGVSNNDAFNAELYAMGGVLILIVVLGSVSLIYNAFSVSVSERTKQFGLLSSVGATRKQIRKMVFFEGFVICAVGIPIGVLCGIAGAGIVINTVLGPSFSEILNNSIPTKITMHVSAAAIAVTIIIGLVTVMISAFLPALRASKVTPIEAIRQTNDIKINKRSKKLKASWIVRKLFGIEGIVASKNFKNNKRKYRSTVVSLTFSIVLFVSASCFTEYLSSMSDIAVSDYGYDIMWMSNSYDESDNMQMYEKLRSAQGVTDSGYIAYTGIEVDVDAARVNDPDADSASGNGKYSIGGYINFIDDDSFREFAKSEGLNPDDYFDSKKLNAICYDQRKYINENGKYTTAETFKKHDKALEAKTGSGFGNITIDYFSGSTPKYSVYYGSGFDIIMPYSSLSKFDVKGMCETYMLFNSSDYQKTSEEMNKILENNGLYGNSVYSIAQQAAMNRALIRIINVFSFGFIVLISLISIVNVFNTISTNIHLRRREFAMLRSIGMTDGGFNKIMIIECIFYGVKSVIYGVTLSTLASYLIFKMTESGFEFSFAFPWRSMLIAVGSVFLVVVITMLYAMSKVKKQNTIEAIKDDNI